MTNYNKSIRNMLAMLVVVVSFFVLQALSELLIPLVVASFFTILCLPLVGFLSHYRVPKIFIVLVVTAIAGFLIYLSVRIMINTAEEILRDREILAYMFRQRIDSFTSWIAQILPDMDTGGWNDYISNFFAVRKMASLIGTEIGSFIRNFGPSFFLFLLYFLFLISSATGYEDYVKYVLGDINSVDIKDDVDLQSRYNMWAKTKESIFTYIGIKTGLSLTTGVITGLICWGFGVRFFLFWGFATVILNYIPSVGSIVATLLPMLMGIVVIDSPGTLLVFAGLLILNQVIVGVILDPILMGSSLRINTVTILFGLLFWGYIWGIMGMLLSVPLMFVIRMLLQRNDDFILIARLMGYPNRKPSTHFVVFNRIYLRFKTLFHKG